MAADMKDWKPRFSVNVTGYRDRQQYIVLIYDCYM